MKSNNKTMSHLIGDSVPKSDKSDMGVFSGVGVSGGGVLPVSSVKGVSYDSTNRRWRLILSGRYQGVFVTQAAAEHAASLVSKERADYQREMMRNRRELIKARGFVSRTVVIHADDMLRFDAFVATLRQFDGRSVK